MGELSLAAAPCARFRIPFRLFHVWILQGYKDPLCAPFPKSIRVVRYILPCEAFAEGGIAVGCGDGNVYLTARDGSVVRPLSGHTKAIVDLSWTATGQLISGSWDGTAIVWDITTGTKIVELQGHENAVCVLGLPNGDIATGSTGRQDERQQHVGYKIRIWRNGSIIKTIEDHGSAVRSLAIIPGIGFMSSSNDGTVRVRTFDGDCIQAVSNPPNADRLNTAYRAAYFATGPQVVTTNEDTIVRIYATDYSLVQELPHPGTPWTVGVLPNGDLVTCCNQSGSSRGHVYVWTRDASRAASEETLAAFAADMAPPAAATGGSTTLGGGEDTSIKILGPYERKNEFRGARDGAIGYFSKSDRTVWICGWSSSAGTWEDLGEVQGVSSDSLAGSYDVERMVTLDESGAGPAALSLRFNFTDDPQTVARNFIARHGLNVDELETVRAFVVQERDKEAAARGIVIDTGSSILAAAAELGRSSFGGSSGGAGLPMLRHFPAQGYLTAVTGVKFDKAIEKLEELSTSAPTPLNATDVDALKALATLLQETSRYHASSLTRPMTDALSKLLHWPVTHLLPVFDFVRVVVTHPNGAEKLIATVPTLLPITIAALRNPASPPAVSLLAIRVLLNSFAQGPTRASVTSPAVFPHLPGFAEAFTGGTEPIKAAVSMLVYNMAVFVAGERTAAGPAAFSAKYSGLYPQTISSFTKLLAASSDGSQSLRYLSALGTLAVCEPAAAKAAFGAAGTKSVLSSLTGPQMDGPASECASDLAPLL